MTSQTGGLQERFWGWLADFAFERWERRNLKREATDDFKAARSIARLPSTRRED